MTSTIICSLVAARDAVAARQEIVHDRPDFDAEERMWASRLCSQQITGLEAAILLEPPTTVADLRLIALTAISHLQDLENDLDGVAGAGGKLIPAVERLTVAFEHIVAHPIFDGGSGGEAGDAIDLSICRKHAATRAVHSGEGL